MKVLHKPFPRDDLELPMVLCCLISDISSYLVSALRRLEAFLPSMTAGALTAGGMGGTASELTLLSFWTFETVSLLDLCPFTTCHKGGHTQTQLSQARDIVLVRDQVGHPWKSIKKNSGLCVYCWLYLFSRFSSGEILPLRSQPLTSPSNISLPCLVSFGEWYIAPQPLVIIIHNSYRSYNP